MRSSSHKDLAERIAWHFNIQAYRAEQLQYYSTAPDEQRGYPTPHHPKKWYDKQKIAQYINREIQQARWDAATGKETAIAHLGRAMHYIADYHLPSGSSANHQRIEGLLSKIKFSVVRLEEPAKTSPEAWHFLDSRFDFDTVKGRKEFARSLLAFCAGWTRLIFVRMTDHQYKRIVRRIVSSLGIAESGIIAFTTRFEEKKTPYPAGRDEKSEYVKYIPGLLMESRQMLLREKNDAAYSHFGQLCRHLVDLHLGLCTSEELDEVARTISSASLTFEQPSDGLTTLPTAHEALEIFVNQTFDMAKTQDRKQWLRSLTNAFHCTTHALSAPKYFPGAKKRVVNMVARLLTVEENLAATRMILMAFKVRRHHKRIRVLRSIRTWIRQLRLRYLWWPRYANRVHLYNVVNLCQKAWNNQQCDWFLKTPISDKLVAGTTQHLRSYSELTSLWEFDRATAAITQHCSACNKQVRMPAEMDGRKVRCPNCHAFLCVVSNEDRETNSQLQKKLIALEQERKRLLLNALTTCFTCGEFLPKANTTCSKCGAFVTEADSLTFSPPF